MYTPKRMRLTRNPWLADVYLKDTFNDFIEGYESMVKTIVNSPDIKSMFQQRVQLMSTSDDLVAGRIRDQSSAKQRFASAQLGASFCSLTLSSRQPSSFRLSVLAR